MRPARPRQLVGRSASALVVVGSVFGISNTAVTPPSTAAREPVSRSSFHSMPGSRKCTWVSITPGSTVRPAASNTSPARRLAEVADRRDLAAADADVGQAPPGVVHHLAAAHDQVEGLSHAAAPSRPAGRSRRRQHASTDRSIIWQIAWFEAGVDACGMLLEVRAARAARAPSRPRARQSALVRGTEQASVGAPAAAASCMNAAVVADEQPHALQRGVGRSTDRACPARSISRSRDAASLTARPASASLRSRRGSSAGRRQRRRPATAVGAPTSAKRSTGQVLPIQFGAGRDGQDRPPLAGSNAAGLGLDPRRRHR